MNRAQMAICAAGAIIASIAGGALPRAASGQGNGKGAPDKDVRVINTPAEAVPVTLNGTGTVQGDVNVVNTPTVNVANTPGVNVVNTPTVKIDRTQPLPVVDASTREPFQEVVRLEGDFGTAASWGSTSFEVPQGKVLVIEYVSAWLDKRGSVSIGFPAPPPPRGSPPSTLPRPHINFHVEHGIGPGGESDDRYAASEPVRFYATGRQEVISLTDPGAHPHTGQLTIVGYLVSQ